MITHAQQPLVSWEEIQDIELVVVRRMQEFATGLHRSVFYGSGFDLVGLRDWQPGDRPSAVDWAQSSLTNFSPLMTREFEQESTASVIIVADTSLSTQCGVTGTPIAKVVARTVATLAIAAAFFQDLVGLVTMNGPARRLVVRPQTGKRHAMHCLEVYQDNLSEPDSRGTPASNGELSGLLRKRSVIPVVSDFLVDDPEPLIDECTELNAFHDVFVVVVDSAFAFELPGVSAGWIEGYDIESGRSRVLSASELERLSDRVRERQDRTEAHASTRGLDVVRVHPGHEHVALSDFLTARRLQKR